MPSVPTVLAASCCQHSAAASDPALVLFTVTGLVFATVHCAGMCGPLILAFRFGEGRSLAAATQLLLYQGGRTLVYGLAGLAVGGAGASLGSQLQHAAAIISYVIVAAFLLAGLAGLGLWPRPRVTGNAPAASPLPSLLNRWTRGIWERTRSRPYLRAAGLGILMAFLPCGLVFLTLGQVAARGDAWTGAGMMAGLVLMTTPILLVAAVTPALLGRWRSRFGPRAAALTWLLAAAWLLLITLAAQGHIPHAQLPVGGFHLMFW
jgi:hypothetical protein